MQLAKVADRAWAVIPVMLWSSAEITTVILAGALPTIPRLIQWLRGQNDSSPSAETYQRPSKPSYVMITQGFADVEAAHLGRRMNSVTAM